MRSLRTAVLIVIVSLPVAAAALFWSAPAQASGGADHVSIRIAELGYAAEGDVDGAVVCTDNIFDGEPNRVRGGGALAGTTGGVVIALDVAQPVTLITLGTVRLTDAAGGIDVSAWVSGPLQHPADGVVTFHANGLARVGGRLPGRRVTVEVTVEDRSLDPGDHAVRIVHNGIPRLAVVHVPEGPTGPPPALLLLPGLLETQWMFEYFGDVRAHADAHGYLAVFVAHYGIRWYLGADPMAGAVDDVGFVRRILDVLEDRFGADHDRLYATGMSYGGFFSHVLACSLNDRIAAFAPVSGTMTEASLCFPGRAVPIVMLHGTNDPLVPYGYKSVLGLRGFDAPGSAAFWAGNNGCASDTVDTPLADVDPNDGTRVVRHDWTGCPSDAPVVLYEIRGGGHNWPGGKPFLPPPVLGGQTYDIVANDVVWDFVSRFTLPQA